MFNSSVAGISNRETSGRWKPFCGKGLAELAGSGSRVAGLRRGNCSRARSHVPERTPAYPAEIGTLPGNTGPRTDSGKLTLMSVLENPAVPFCLMAILLAGFGSACAARLSVGSRRQTVCQSIFFFCLVVVGGVMVASLGLAPCFWVFPAFTFSVMVLMATCDFGRSRQATAW